MSIPTVSHSQNARTAHSKKIPQRVLESLPPAWIVVNHDMLEKPLNRHEAHTFWWNSTGVTLAILLEKAGYSFEDQLRHLKLYSAAIIPELGEGPALDGCPKHWRSFMTDHHCPVEFSWEWNRRTELPVVRFSFEPIGVAAGTSRDPYNQHAALSFVEKHHTELHGCDLLWFKHFWNTIVHFDERRDSLKCFNNTEDGASLASTHQSRAFLALELNTVGLVLKAYYLPEFQARAKNCSRMAVINAAIKSLPCISQNVQSAHRNLLVFLESRQGRSLTPEIVATDCVAPEKSRIKIYMRNQSTTLDSVIETLCLGKTSERQRLQDAIKEFTKVWKLVFGLGEDSTGELPHVRHRTGGILYYFGMESEHSILTVKVYLPVRHYAKGDREAAAGLQNYIRSTSRADYSHKYIEAIDNLMLSSSQDKPKGLQTYYTVSLKDGGLRLTSYLAPKVYQKAN